MDYNKHRDACFTAANGLYIDSTLVPYYSVDTIANSTSVNINWANSFWGISNNGQPRVIKTAAIAGQEGAFIDGYILVGDSLIPYYARWHTIPALSLSYVLHEMGWGSWRDNLKSLNSCLPPKCCKKLCNRPFYELKVVQEDPCKLSLKAMAKRLAAQRFAAYLDSSVATFRKAYLAKCLRPLQMERFQGQLQVFQYHYTLYYYDQAGNLSKTVPPAGVKPFGNSDAVFVNQLRLAGNLQKFAPNHFMATTYQYNSLNALCWQKTPDAGESKFYYDDLGRLVVSQNAKQIAVSGAVKEYRYTLFDPLGRIVEVGQINQANPMTDLLARTPASLNAWLSTTSKTQITRTKYDEADYALLDTTLFNPKNLRNRVVYSSYAASNSNFYEHAVHYSYDAHGNVKTLLREIKGLVPLLNDYKLVHYKYDLVSGKVNEVAYQTGMADQYMHKYNYDAENRLVSVETGPGKYQLDEDARYRYYLHGPLARMELGKLQVQGLDYAYTLQGWLKGVNSSHLQTQRDLGRDGYQGSNGFSGNSYFPADAYGFTLGYYEGDYQMIGNMAQSESFVSATAGSSAGNQSPDLYNGNIRMMSVAISQFGVYPLLNSYKYDQLNRLVSSTSFNQFDSVANAYTNNATALPQYLNTFSYDANGNILKQLRNGGPTQVAMDSLHYEYEMVAGLPTNKLRRVTDAVAASNYVDDIDKQVDYSNYTYDEIGNLTQDKSEQIRRIEWNVYGKIQRIIRIEGSERPDLEFEYSPDGHRVVKIVKPKNGNQNLYTYYVRDAQGNVLATYERSFAKILDFQNITFAKINDTLVKYTGLSGLAEFSAQYSNIETIRNAYMNHLGNSSEFLQTFSPYQFLKDDQNKLDTLLNRIELAEFLNLLFTASPPDFETVCRCLKNRHEKNSNYAPLMRAFVVDSASLMNLFLAMEMTNYGDYIPALAARLGFENLDIEEAKNQLCHYVYGNNGNGSNLKILFDELYVIDEGFRDCGPSVSNFLFKLHTDQPNKLIELLVVIPEIRDVFYFQAGQTKFDCLSNIPFDDMAILMSNNYSEISWNKLIDAFGTNTILSYFVNNQSSYFMNQAVLYNKSILTNTQQNQNLYGGNYGGLENYFTYIRNYFGQGLYDQITAGFMQQSSVYTDSLRLEEWHMYGSSRIGIYQTNKAMAQRTVRIENGVTTQLSNTHIEQVSQSRFYTERGAKRYELTNHLGNVLTVVTDKKLPVCTGTSVSYFIADVVSATDYSPFGAPLAERTWQGSEYRYGFNGQERDDEVAGAGYITTAEFWEYDSRLGRRWNVDPVLKFWDSPYSSFSNNPIWFNDKFGNDTTGGFISNRSRNEFNQTYNELNNRIENVRVGIKKLEAKENLSKRDVNSLNSLKSKLEGYLKIKEALDEIISNKEVRFIFHATNCLGSFEDGETGEENGVVIIRWEKGNMTALVHEVRHGYGFIKKEWKNGEGIDYVDELEAWKFTEIWDYNKVKESLEKASLSVPPEERMNFSLRNMIEISYPNIKEEYRDWQQHKVE